MKHALIATLLLASACAPIARAPSPATVALPERFALLDAETASAGTPRDLLPERDPAYAPLATRALTDAPDLSAALARIEIARANTRAARAERLPNIDGSAGVTGTRASDSNFSNLPPGIVIDRTQTLFEAGVSASWDADLFGRLRAAERAAGARLDAATAEAAAVRIALASDIGLALTDYRAADARRAVIDEDLRETRDLVSVTRVRTDAGIAPGFDLVRAQSLEADARSRLEPVAAERAAAIAALVTLTALPTDDVLATLSSPLPFRGGAGGGGGLAEVSTPPPLDIPSLLLRRRPDIIAAERRLAAADFEIAGAAAERFPRLSITGALGLAALAFGNLFDTDAITGSLGAGLAGPLLDFGRVGARIDLRQAEAAEAFALYRRSVFVALGDVERALGQLAAADRRAAVLAERVTIDRDSLSLARERYRRGLTDFLTVIDAQRTLNIVREAEITARADQSRRRIDLFRAIGGSG